MKENETKEKELNSEILKFKKINNRNSAMIIALLAILLFVCIIMLYVRFLGWFFILNKIKYS